MRIQDIRIGLRVWFLRNGPVDEKAFDRTWEVVGIDREEVRLGGPGARESICTATAEEITPFEEPARQPMRATMLAPVPGLFNGTWGGHTVCWQQESGGRGSRPMYATVEEYSNDPYAQVIVDVAADGSILASKAPPRRR